MCIKYVLFVVLLTFVNAGDFVGDYYVSENKLDWFAAQRFCTYHGMYLIDIPHEKELANVLNVVNALRNRTWIGNGSIWTSIWTSGTRLNDEKNYYWATTGQPLEFQNWTPGDPNYGLEKCMITYHGNQLKFADHQCTNKFIFICRKHQVSPFFNRNICAYDPR